MSNENVLGPFHVELLSFLKQSSTFAPSPENEFFSFFNPNRQIHLEKELLDAFHFKEFEEFGLKKYYPKMYRGLPRLYARDNPSQSVIKQNFAHLPSLKWQLASPALFSRYQLFDVEKGKVTLFTWVIGGGLGDYMAARATIHLLKEQFPELTLHMVAVLPEQYKDWPLPEKEEVLLVPFNEAGEFPLDALELLRDSDLILQMPTFFPKTKEVLAMLQKIPSSHPFPKMELLGEYGYVESSWFHPKTGGFSMGLHFLEKGILLRKKTLRKSEKIENQKLASWMKSENRFFLAYLISPIGGAIYLHALLKSLEHDPKDVDLCTPDLGWFIDFAKERRDPFLEWGMGVSCIEVYLEDQMYAMPISQEGKKVRLLCPGTISQNDFRALLALSGEFVGVRGDQSFSEAVSENKVFFYDCLEHARYFMKDLLALAENRIQNQRSALQCFRCMAKGFLHNIPPQEEEWVDEVHFQEKEEWQTIALELAACLQDPDTLVGYRKLNQIIAEECSANDFICHLVQRALCHKKYPLVEQMEREQIDLFIKKQQSFGQTIQKIYP